MISAAISTILFIKGTLFPEDKTLFLCSTVLIKLTTLLNVKVDQNNVVIWDANKKLWSLVVFQIV